MDTFCRGYLIGDQPDGLCKHILTGVRTVESFDSPTRSPTDYTDDAILQASVETMLAETGFASAHLTIVGQTFRSVGHSDAVAAKEFMAMLCKFLKELQQFATVASRSLDSFTSDQGPDYRLRLTLAGVKAEVKKYYLAVLASADEADEYENPRLLLAHAEAMLQAVDQNSKTLRCGLIFMSSGNASRCGSVYRSLSSARHFRELFRTTVLADRDSASEALFKLLS